MQVGRLSNTLETHVCKTDAFQTRENMKGFKRKKI